VEKINCLLEGSIVMGRRPELTTEVKVEIVERYLQGESPSWLSKRYGFHVDSLKEWVKKYQENGVAGLTYCMENQHYSREFKEQVVQDYNSGAGSELDLALRYGIPSRRAVSSWIKQYNGHGACNSYLGGQHHVTKGKKNNLARTH
jgi:transposase